jgi:large subunit ribosomal protein L6
MSRIGNNPIPVPDTVDVKIDGTRITVKGPKGTLERVVDGRISVDQEGATLVLRRANDDGDTRARHGLTRALLNNMVVGVSEGFRKDLQMVGVGYRANLQGSRLELQVGFSHPIVVEAPTGIDFEVPEPTRIGISGIDKELVGQVAANIRKVRPPEPYKGKGIRYVDERVRRKAGKAGVTA